MLKLSFWRMMATLLLALVVSACGGGNGSSAAAPADFKVTPGNGQVTITWTASPDVQYWMMYAQTATPIDIKNPPGNHFWVTNISSPYILAGLTNGLTYSFAMNGRTSGGPGGAQTVSQTVTPRYAGASWSTGSTTVTGTTNLYGLAYGTASDASVDYVAVGTGGKIFKATDGINWVAATPTSVISTDFKGAVYAFGKFIAVGSNLTPGLNNILASADLLTWSSATLNSGSITTGINAIASNGVNLLVAVGDSGTAYFSTDGSSWTPATLTNASGNSLKSVAYSASNGIWVAVGQNGTVITSNDGSNWTAQASTAGSNTLNGVTVTSANGFVAVGDSGTIVTSSGGIAWAPHALTVPTPPNLYAVSTDSNQFLAVGQSGTAFASLDGSTWIPVTTGITTADLRAILGGVSGYVVVGVNGTNITAK